MSVLYAAHKNLFGKSRRRGGTSDTGYAEGSTKGSCEASIDSIDDVDSDTLEYGERQGSEPKSGNASMRAVHEALLPPASDSQNEGSDKHTKDAEALNDMSHTSIRHQPLPPLNASHGQVEQVWENQRGTAILGKARFSAKSLLPSDRGQWTDSRGHYTLPRDKIQLPDSSQWEWVSDWMIDMASGNVDPDGWQYAFNFSGFKWSGSCKFTSNVRRRCWIRFRQRVNPSMDPEKAIPVAAEATRIATLSRPSSSFDTGARSDFSSAASRSQSPADSMSTNATSSRQRADLDKHTHAAAAAAVVNAPKPARALALVRHAAGKHLLDREILDLIMRALCVDSKDLKVPRAWPSPEQPEAGAANAVATETAAKTDGPAVMGVQPDEEGTSGVYPSSTSSDGKSADKFDMKDCPPALDRLQSSPKSMAHSIAEPSHALPSHQQLYSELHDVGFVAERSIPISRNSSIAGDLATSPGVSIDVAISLGQSLDDRRRNLSQLLALFSFEASRVFALQIFAQAFPQEKHWIESVGYEALKFEGDRTAWAHVLGQVNKKPAISILDRANDI